MNQVPQQPSWMRRLICIEGGPLGSKILANLVEINPMSKNITRDERFGCLWSNNQARISTRSIIRQILLEIISSKQIGAWIRPKASVAPTQKQEAVSS